MRLVKWVGEESVPIAPKWPLFALDEAGQRAAKKGSYALRTGARKRPQETGYPPSEICPRDALGAAAE